MPLKNQASGLSTRHSISMEPTSAMATRSGSLIDRRLGTRSAITMKRAVMLAKEAAKPSVAAGSGAITTRNAASKCGVNAPSPTMPARMATVLTPICTTVK